MDWVWFLFEFDGRISRAKAWLALLIILCWMILVAVLMIGVDEMFGNPAKSVHFSINDVFALIDPAALRAAVTRLQDGKEASPAHLVLTFFHAVGTLIFAWIYLATSVKRLHDRDKSGWWAVPYLVFPGVYSQFQDRMPDSHWVFPLAVATVLLMIAGFVDIYCLRGTGWTNRFGPNPLPKAQARRRGRQGGSRSSSGEDQNSTVEFVPHHASSPPAMHVKRGHD